MTFLNTLTKRNEIWLFNSSSTMDDNSWIFGILYLRSTIGLIHPYKTDL